MKSVTSGARMAKSVLPLRFPSGWLGMLRLSAPRRRAEGAAPMSAEEHDHDQVEPVSQTPPVSPAQPVSQTEPLGGAQPGKQRLRSAWLGSRRFAVLAGVIA